MMEDKNKYKYLIQNTILLTLSSLGSKLLSFFLVPLYTNVLSTTDYGTADIITTSAMLLIYVFTMNISSSVLRFAIDKNEKPDRVLHFALKVLGIGTLIVSLGVLIFFQLKIADWQPFCYFFLIAVFFADAIQSILNQYLRAVDKVRVMAVSCLLETAIRLLTNIATLLWFKWGLVGYLISLVVGPVVSSVYSVLHLIPLKKSETDRFYEKKLHKEMISYAIPSAVSQLGWWVNNSLDKYFVLWLQGASLNGIYAISYKIPGIMSMLCNIFGQAWGISAIKDFDSKDKDGFFSNTYNVFNAFLVFSCSALIMVNVPISKVLYAKDFFEAWKYSSLLIVAMLFSGLSSFFNGIFSAVKKNKVLALTTFLSATVNIIFNSILIPIFGVLGAAIATAISFYVVWVSRFISSRKYIKFKINLIRDHIVYVLLIVQIVFEHIENHFYIGQIIVFLTIILLNIKDLKKCIYKLEKIIKLKTYRA